MALQVYENLSVRADDFGELSCKECAKSGRNIESLNYCVECKSLYCLECLQNHQEDNGKIGKNNKWKKQTIHHDFPQGIPTMLENNNRYHSVACMLQQQEEENKIRTDIRGDLEHVQTKLHQMMHAQTAATKDRLEKLRANTQHKFEHLNSCINNLIDELKSTVLDKMNQAHKEIEEQFSVKVATLTRLQTKTDAAFKKLNETDNKNELDELASFATQTKEDTHKIEQDTEYYYSNISENVTRAEWQTLDATLHETMDGFICDVYALVQRVLDNDEENQETHNIQSFVEYNVQAESDQSLCDINSACFMKDESVILTDWNNNNIKWLNVNFDIINVCPLPGIPWAVYCYSDSEVLVSLYLLQRIQWLTLQGDTMMLGRSIKVRNPCKGIACCSDRIYVSCGGNGIMECPGQIQVYDTNGNFLQTYLYDHSGKPILSNPQHLVVGLYETGYKLYIADKNLGLISIDIRTGESYELNDDIIKKIDMKGMVSEAKGVCVKANKSVVVCDFKQGNLVEIESTKDGYDVKNICMSQHSVTNPNSVCFNEKQMKLLVTSGNTNEIQAYDLTNRTHCKGC